MSVTASNPQSFERWFPVADVPAVFGGFTLCQNFESFRLTLHPAKGSDRELILDFGGAVTGYRVFEEFAHPRFHQETSPEVSPDWAWGPYPLLMVRGSEWLRTFSESQLIPWVDEMDHYFIYTLSHSIDILARAQPKAHWQPTLDLIDNPPLTYEGHE